jgi:membrane peptidoglycan carboxypeptidase
MDPSLVQPVPAAGVDAAAAARPRSRRGRLQKVSIAAGLVLLAAATLVFEMRTSRLQSALLSRFDRGFAYTVEPGAAAALPAPDGPYDARLGYTRLPEFRDRLEKQGFAVTAQARPSARMREAVARGIFPIYAEKSQAGLVVNDRLGRAIYEVAVPERVYESFAAIPAPVVRAVVFVENRDVLDAGRPYLNPAVEWPRLAKAVWVDVAGRFGRPGQSIGASTLATQIEKFRHSSEGRTRSSSEKLTR